MIGVTEEPTTGIREYRFATWTRQPEGNYILETDFKTTWPRSMSQQEINVVCNQAFSQAATSATANAGNKIEEIVHLPNGRSIVVGGYFRRDPAGNVVGKTCYPLVEKTSALTGQPAYKVLRQDW